MASGRAIRGGYENDKDMETGNGNGVNLNKIETREELRNHLTQSTTISPALFEELFLSPKNDVAGDLRKTFANPTPLGVMGFAVALFPLSIEFMGWRGSGVFGTATTTCSIWYGGMLLIFAGVGEFILGNTFPFIVFMGYGAHFLTFATTFMPYYAAVEWNSGGEGAFAPGPGFAGGFGFYPLALAMLSFVFLICSLRTNLVFVLVFLLATIGFSFASATLWFTATGATGYAGTMSIATGACFFAADLLGWYLFTALMFAIMELPIPGIPVVDLSTVIKAKGSTKSRNE